MRIDPHVHCRDGSQNYKETIAHVFKLCDKQGINIIFDMPNTSPPILTPQDVEKRLALVPRKDKKRYRIFIGATSDKKQLTRASDMAQDSKSVVGLKLYAGRSVGNLAITVEEKQRRIYEILSAANYKGVLAVHCEKDSLIKNIFDPDKPVTHCLSRPKEAEVESISDQIEFAQVAGFKGTLHICHISTASSIDIISRTPENLKITCGVTPHHLLWSSARYHEPNGLLYRENPPLRDTSDTIALRKALKSGIINWIETDHSPHPISEKLYPPYLPGYPSLCLYRLLVEEILPQWGFDDKLIERVTYANIVNTFDERKLLNDY